uniref:NADH-ubiquinone oxidoreductase chain 6 n=1 Tax=Matuta planipes TaxID=1235672 RepID=A0A345HHZ6_MATPL|nr:NADH dehydrogenase subunit 6 [Matuta planipes]AXG76236.1 NADH dehydrogenase subunit 6 [Matuta planipes]QIA95920.1 NADH dehydrogenase subunit 6 [Matuta planipes]
MIMLFSLCTLIFSILFMQLLHPLSLALVLIIQTMIISMLTGFFMYSFWFSYVLFMIFLGGVLVLFIYVTSLASNEQFSYISPMKFMFFISAILCSVVVSLLLDPMLLPSFSMIPVSTINMNMSLPFIVSWIYNNTLMFFTLFVVLYLLLTLLVVVKITNLFKGPLRTMN